MIALKARPGPEQDSEDDTIIMPNPEMTAISNSVIILPDHRLQPNVDHYVRERSRLQISNQ